MYNARMDTDDHEPEETSLAMLLHSDEYEPQTLQRPLAAAVNLSLCKSTPATSQSTPIHSERELCTNHRSESGVEAELNTEYDAPDLTESRVEALIDKTTCTLDPAVLLDCTLSRYLNKLRMSTENP